MAEVTVGSLGSILPEILLLIGGLLILLFDMAAGDRQDSGVGFTAISVIFLIASTIAVLFMMVNTDPHLAAGVVSIDLFGMFLKVTIYVSMALVALAGGSYMNRKSTGRGEFWTLFMFVTLAMSFAVSANNLLLLFLSIEFLSITSYILAGFLRDDKRSSEAGVKYFLYGSVASSVMLYGFSLFYGATGTLDLTQMAAAFEANEDLLPVVLPAGLLTLVGLGFKASLAPFYQWAPDTYEGAPIPVTAYLSTASKAVGLAVMVRFLLTAMGGFRAEWVPILAGLSILTMTLGNLAALRQTSVKRMLAYSSVAQAGYILMGLVGIVTTTEADLASLSMNGLNGLLIYIFAYLFTNIGAFMVLLAVEEVTGSNEISAFNGLSQRSASLAFTMMIFLLSLTGIPLTGGFMGKFYVFGAAVQHQYFWLAGIALINAGIAAGYYLNIVRAMFFISPDGESSGQAFPIGIGVQLSLIICVIATFWLGIYPTSFIEWANDASRQLLALSF